MTPYQQHVLNWRDCIRCPLHEHRTQVVFARGKLPCDVAFVGTAPGASEDSLGSPFVGPAGQLLDKIIARAIAPPEDIDLRDPWNDYLRIAFYNLVGCFPLEEKRMGNEEPPREAIEACAPRLREFIVLAKPRLIVTVGSLAEKWVPKIIHPPHPKPGQIYKADDLIEFVTIVHPAFILSRLHPTAQPLAVQKCIVTIADAVEALET